ncbi:MAG: MgtC/SapB family protein [Thermomicrobiales bacterium]|nr:MgtC/SapB family protein [Thermomicrobiales bacterium]
MTVQEAGLRLLVAATLGSLIGLDRERSDRAAGLRTHALVATASALIMIVSAFGFDDAVQSGSIVLDPSRVAAQVVSGVGFLGAGVIILRQNIVRGLTTAAGVWAVAGIGLAAGSGLFAVSIIATSVFLIILVGLRPLEQAFFASKRSVHVSIQANRHQDLLIQVEQEATAAGLEIQLVSVEPGNGGPSTISIRMRGADRRMLADFADRIRKLAGVRLVAYTSNGMRIEELRGEMDNGES